MNSTFFILFSLSTTLLCNAHLSSEKGGRYHFAPRWGARKDTSQFSDVLDEDDTENLGESGRHLEFGTNIDLNDFINRKLNPSIKNPVKRIKEISLEMEEFDPSDKFILSEKFEAKEKVESSEEKGSGSEKFEAKKEVESSEEKGSGSEKFEAKEKVESSEEKGSGSEKFEAKEKVESSEEKGSGSEKFETKEEIESSEEKGSESEKKQRIVQDDLLLLRTTQQLHVLLQKDIFKMLNKLKEKVANLVNPLNELGEEKLEEIQKMLQMLSFDNLDEITKTLESVLQLIDERELPYNSKFLQEPLISNLKILRTLLNIINFDSLSKLTANVKTKITNLFNSKKCLGRCPKDDDQSKTNLLAKLEELHITLHAIPLQSFMKLETELIDSLLELNSKPTDAHVLLGGYSNNQGRFLRTRY